MSARSLMERWSLYGQTFGAALFAAGVMAASGCSSSFLNQPADQALPFSDAQQAEQQARETRDLAERREGLAAAYELYAAVIAVSKEGSKHIDRARIAAAQLQKELAVPGGANYDAAELLLDDAVKNSPTAYLADRARREKDAIQANREAVRRHRAVFDNTPDGASDEQWETALDALLSLAASYESLNDYETAIREYERLTRIANERSKEANDVFYRKAAKAQFNIGHIYCYEYFDYGGGAEIFFQLKKAYPLSDQAKAAAPLMEDINRSLKIINGLSLDNMRPAQEAQSNLAAARIWESPPLLNRVYALRNYQRVVRDWSRTLAAREAAFRIGWVYQHNGDYLKALDAYEAALRDYPQSKRGSQAIYNRAVCYEAVGEYELAYKEYQAAALFGFGTIDKYNKEAKRKVNRFEQDEDGDGYQFYQERQHGSSDEDKDSYPGSVQPSVSRKRGAMRFKNAFEGV